MPTTTAGKSTPSPLISEGGALRDGVSTGQGVGSCGAGRGCDDDLWAGSTITGSESLRPLRIFAVGGLVSSAGFGTSSELGRVFLVGVAVEDGETVGAPRGLEFCR